MSTLGRRLDVASRANVPPFHVMDLLAAASERQRTHGDLVNFVAGQPSTGAPEAVRAEAVRLLSGLRSNRGVEYLDDFRTRLEPYRGHRAVREFHARMDGEAA